MSKKSVCLNNESIGYWSGCGGLDIRKIEYGVNDHVFAIGGAWTNKKTYHRLKVYYSGETPFIKYHGYKVPFTEIIRERYL